MYHYSRGESLCFASVPLYPSPCLVYQSGSPRRRRFRASAVEPRASPLQAQWNDQKPFSATYSKCRGTLLHYTTTATTTTTTTTVALSRYSSSPQNVSSPGWEKPARLIPPKIPPPFPTRRAGPRVPWCRCQTGGAKRGGVMMAGQVLFSLYSTSDTVLTVRGSVVLGRDSPPPSASILFPGEGDS
jgi:hypothetical protein